MATGHDIYAASEMTHIEWRRHDGVVLQRAIYSPISGSPSLSLGDEIRAAYDVYVRPESAKEWAKVLSVDPEARTIERLDL